MILDDTVKIKADTLSDYLTATNENHNLHAEKEPHMMAMIHKMDRIFHEEIFEHEYDANAATMLLAMNSYMMLSNSVHQALSGHMVAVFPVARAALESACYAFLTSSDEKMSSIWFDRGKSKTATSRCRDEFSVKKAARKLRAEYPELADYIDALYDSTIEYGAHPNIRSVSQHLKDKGLVDDVFRVFKLAGIYDVNSHEVNTSLLLCLEVGQAIVFLLSMSAKDHPLLKVRHEVFQSWIDEKNAITSDFTDTM